MSTQDLRIWLSLACAVVGLGVTGCEESRAPATSYAVSAPTAPPSLPPVSTAATPAAAGAEETVDTAAPPAAAEPQPTPAKIAPSGAPQNITFDTIKFPLEKNADYKPEALTPEIVALNGRAVRLRGYILPSFQQSGITQFVLVRDNRECCFGPGAALYDCVVVDMKPGKTTDFTVRPVAVEGTFELRDFKGPDGKYLAIYHLDGESVGF